MVQKLDPMLLTDSKSDSMSDFAAFRIIQRKVEFVREVFLEIEFWNGGRLSGTLSASNLVKMKKQIDKILKGKHYAQIQKGPESHKEEDFIEDFEANYSKQRT